MNPRVKEVIPLENFRLKLEFTNGEIKFFDWSPFLEFGVFKELQSNVYFNQVKASGGSVYWPNEQDICPDTLYLDSSPGVG